MPSLPLVYAPDPIFKKKAEPVAKVDDEVRDLVARMFETLYRENGVGLGANMVGLLQRIIVIDLQEDGAKQPLPMINPEITWSPKEEDTHTEASLSFPGISAEISRPKEIEVTYLDLQGSQKSLKTGGFLATVIQHEIDYLDGKVYLDYLSPMKRNLLLKKMKKHMKREGIGS